MKHFVFFLILICLFIVFSIGMAKNTASVQLIVTVPQLESVDIKEKLELEFNKVYGIKESEVSLQTKTVLIEYDHSKVSLSDINSVFQKWDCIPRSYNYQKLY